MKIITVALIIFFLPVCGWPATEKQLPLVLPNEITSVGVASAGAIGTVLGRADVALCKSIILPSHLKGDVGEGFMGKMFSETRSFLGKVGWELVSPRLGRQGIDGIFIRFDANGNPRGLIVAESKYGTGNLNPTKRDGFQLSERWCIKRLKALSRRYTEVAGLRKPTIVSQPIRGTYVRHRIEIDLGDGQKAVFWRKDARDDWKYDGPPEMLNKAQKKARMISNYLEGAANGKITYDRRLFKFKLDGDVLKVSVGDASIMSSSGRVPVTASYDIELSGLKRANM